MLHLPPVAKRFVRYVALDTQSQEDSTTYPSTDKQKNLCKLLVQELLELGLKDAAMDEYGYVMATLESNVVNKKNVPVLGFLAHVDTSPDMSGKDVKYQVHYDYKGGPIKLNDQYTLTPEQCPELNDNIGRTIITSDGTTLLGGDDKAGVAEIMTMLERLIADPGIPHGKIRVAFTVDEEVGTGTKFFDVKKFGAQYAYTVDGSGIPGEIENETFSADAARVVFSGVNVHPGSAKDKMVNSIKAASDFVALLPKDKAPETTEGRQGFVHPTDIKGGVDSTTVKLILRSFDTDELLEQQRLIRELADKVKTKYPKLQVEAQFEESYRNMRVILDQHPKVVEFAKKAVALAGISPKLNQIRGGTDGSRLSFMGLPTANLFAGGNLMHSRYEWVAVEVMEFAVETLVNIAKICAQES